MSETVVKGLLKLKDKMSKTDYVNLEGFLNDLSNRVKDGGSAKLVVCTPTDLYIEMQPSLDEVMSRTDDMNKIRDMYKDCYTYMLDINNSYNKRNFNILICNRVLSISIEGGV